MLVICTPCWWWWNRARYNFTVLCLRPNSSLGYLTAGFLYFKQPHSISPLQATITPFSLHSYFIWAYVNFQGIMFLFFLLDWLPRSSYTTKIPYEDPNEYDSARSLTKTNEQYYSSRSVTHEDWLDILLQLYFSIWVKVTSQNFLPVTGLDKLQNIVVCAGVSRDFA